MRTRIWIIFGCCSLGMAANVCAQGQDTLLQGATIEVTQSYKPEIKSVSRSAVVPDLPPRDTTTPAFDYQVPQLVLNYTYAALPLRPLTLARDTASRKLENYVKAGAGNLSTFYLDAGFSGLRGPHYETAIHLHHLSMQGNISKQQTALSGMEITGAMKTGRHTWSALVAGSRNQYYRYGGRVDPLSPDHRPSLAYTQLKASLKVENYLPDSGAGIHYTPEVQMSTYGRDFKNQENTFSFYVPVSKPLAEDITVGAAVQGAVSVNNIGGNHFSNNLFQFTPFLRYDRSDFRVFMSLSPAWGKGGTMYFLPDFRFSWKSPGAPWLISAGWKSVVRQNTYEQLSTINPFLSEHYQTRQTKAETVYAAVERGFGQHVNMSLRLSHVVQDQMPVYMNDTAFGKSFYILYGEKVKKISLEGGFEYQAAYAFRTGVTVVLNNYYQHSGLKRVWHEPTFQLRGFAAFRPARNLYVSGSLMMLGGLYALTPAKEEISLGTILDASCQAEYSFIPRLSAYVQINNLFHNLYERWYGYEVYGFNILVGLRVKF